MQAFNPRRPIRFLSLLCILMISVSPAAAEGEATGTVSSEIQELRQLLLDQQRQIDELRRLLVEQKGNGGALPATVLPSQKPGEVGGVAPIVSTPASEPALPSPVAQNAEGATNVPAPLSLRIGDAYLTPVGFMDLTGVFRDTTAGTNIGTNFGSIPYRTQAAVAGNLSEVRLSPQNSRIGMRVDTIVKDTKVLAYWESDFLGALGNPPLGNVAVSTNSYGLRLRLFWVDLKREKWEILGGQTWSLITPGRSGVSPLPADVFYGQAVDVNYVLGIPWGRTPELRFVYRPNKTVSMAFALDSPEQYIGGSAGGGVTVLPAALAATYSGELNNGTTVLAVPNLHPDLITKVAFDGTFQNGNGIHFEVAGVERTFKTYNPGSSTVSGQHFTKAGGAVSANLNLELLRGVRLLTNNYYSDGGGRYLFGEAPDLVIGADGNISLVHSMGTLSGFEFTRNNTMLYAYYGGLYIGRNVVVDANGSKVGYGFSGAPNSQNKSVQEATFGLNHTFWKDVKWGALNFMAQYAYFSRNPWFLAAGTPTYAYLNEIWLNLRYTLPGLAPNSK